MHCHGKAHISQDKFLCLIRTQLATDRGHDADCTSLSLFGARGALFKVRLSSYGYTLVAKGMESFNQRYLARESKIYSRLRPIQGKYVPVCFGIVELKRPYHYDGGVYPNFLFLSWAGRNLRQCSDPASKSRLMGGVTTALKELHQLGVLLCNAEPRNILLEPSTGSIMLIDFERSRCRNHEPLASTSSNRVGRKRKRGTVHEDDFAKELRSALELVERRLSMVNNRG